jgi:hypothetical protein
VSEKKVNFISNIENLNQINMISFGSVIETTLSDVT